MAFIGQLPDKSNLGETLMKEIQIRNISRNILTNDSLMSGSASTMYSHNMVGDLSSKFYCYQIFVLVSVVVQSEYC